MGSDAKMPEAVWEGTFSVGGMSLTVYVLDDGRRIIGAESFAALFGGSTSVTPDAMQVLTEFMRRTDIPSPTGAKDNDR